jgi:nucleoid-associated protein YgaU
MNLKKAFIQIVNGKNKDTKIEVLFNPAEYSIEKSNQFQSTPIVGLNTPLTQFTNGNARTVTMDLFFDTYEKNEDVRDYTNKVFALLQIDSELHAPPICEFFWDSSIIKATVEKVSGKYTMFLFNGIPVRATLNVTFKEYATLSEQLSGVKLSSSDKTKIVTTQQGDMLWQLAAKQYGDPGLWRNIADANNIDDPLAIEAGIELNIPSITQKTSLV